MYIVLNITIILGITGKYYMQTSESDLDNGSVATFQVDSECSGDNLESVECTPSLERRVGSMLNGL